jgi:ribosomal protein L40E
MSDRGSLFVICKRCHTRTPKIGSSVRMVLGLRRHVCMKCAAEMVGGEQPSSREGQVRAFFEANPHEELTLHDMEVKFSLTNNRAYKIAHRLKLKGLIRSSGTVPVVYRGLEA